MAIALDIPQHPQRTKIMNIVWPLTGLYLPIVGWWLYDNMARPRPMCRCVVTGRQRFLRSVFVSTTHCASGCVAGDIIGTPIVFAAGWTIFGERLYAEYVVLFCLAYSFGIAFQYFPIRAARKIAPRSALVEAVKADTLGLDCIRSRAVCLDGRGLFLRYAATGINFAILLVHDADRHGYRVHYESAAELVSCPIGRKARHVVAAATACPKPTPFSLSTMRPICRRKLLTLSRNRVIVGKTIRPTPTQMAAMRSARVMSLKRKSANCDADMGAVGTR
jgi:hypothetical protein